MAFLRFYLAVFVITFQHIQAERYKTIYQKIQEESDYDSFNDLVRNNKVAQLHLHYEPLTVFVPQNEAFDSYEGDTYADLAFYHMSFDVRSMESLVNTKAITSVNLNNPPLWINELNGDIYVNNAKILKDRSNYASKSRSGHLGQQQMLHMIDAVLDPMIRSPEFSPNAYDLLTSIHKWNLGASKSVTKFYQKVQANKLLEVFKEIQPHTFFIPLDSGIDAHKYNLIDEEVILRHVVPNHVIFSRMTETNPVIIMTGDQSAFTLTIEHSRDGLFVKGKPKDSAEDVLDEFSSEIIIPNIPVKNGVVHLISKPLGAFRTTLNPFPYLSVLDKVTNDPELNVFYQLGQSTKFNKKLERTNVSYTYFVARDSSWFQTNKLGLVPTEDNYDILARHLVTSELPYSMKQLASMTRMNNYSDIELHSEGGALKISVFKINGYYYVIWNKKYIQVVRPDYICSDGIVHILKGPMVDFKSLEVYNSEVSRVKFSRLQIFGNSLKEYWNVLVKLMP